MTNSNRMQAPQVAAAALVIRGKSVLLVKQGAAPNRGLWAIPGGSVGLGETLQQAAEREVKEETGLIVKAGEPVHVFDYLECDETGALRFHYVIVDILADYLSGEPAPADDAADAGWFETAELETMEVSKTTLSLLRKVHFLP